MSSGQLMVGILAAFSPILGILLAGVGWFYRKEHERRINVEKQLSDKKYDTYMKLIKVFYGMVKDQKGLSKPTKQDDLIRTFMDTSRDLMMYGSDGVVKAYQSFMNCARNPPNKHTADMIWEFAELVIEMRKDMGHPKTKIDAEDFLRQFINDFDELSQPGGMLYRG